MIKWLLIAAAIAVTGLVGGYYYSEATMDILRDRSMDRLVFPSQHYTLERVCFRNLIGLSFHGEVYDFYQYKVSGDVDIVSAKGYPRFDTLIQQERDSVIFYPWTATPISDSSVYDYIRDLTSLIPLREGDCPRAFQEREYLSRPGSYYSYTLSRFAGGNLLLIYVPAEKMLYVISKG